MTSAKLSVHMVSATCEARLNEMASRALGAGINPYDYGQEDPRYRLEVLRGLAKAADQCGELMMNVSAEDYALMHPAFRAMRASPAMISLSRKDMGLRPTNG